ncbi:unnamed protein product [Plutella xylostella]|uniref:(diamondback moth) hypothetical protein n=1 Tax=Plutella xylostella TaxID=51655 RepID=A0A8S4G7D3_PLUXY|nr:unnamed protein product [Plutella xylostella]
MKLFVFVLSVFTVLAVVLGQNLTTVGTKQLSASVLKSRAKSIESICYDKYITKVEDSIKSNPKMFWSFFKNKCKSNTLPSLMTLGTITASSGKQICDLFAEFFNSTFLDPVTDQSVNDKPSFNLPLDANLSCIEINEELVKVHLRKLDVSKSAGPDFIPPLMLRNCTDTIAQPLSLLFKRSVSEGAIPLTWKKAFITPVHKKGSKSEVTHYRPISKLCIIAKVFEKIIYDQVYNSVKNSFNSSQHGFLKKRSTVSNLILFNDCVTNNMEEGFETDVIYTDYSKAFDRIDHSILIMKLESAGIRGDLLRWFRSYISNRSQVVVTSNYISSWTKVPSGVPQGSLLGPLLFVIFISDIDECFPNSQVVSFADDMKIFKKITSEVDCALLQDDLNRLSSYCAINRLDLNAAKCYCVTFSRKLQKNNFSYKLKEHQITRTVTIKDLGIIQDDKLHYDKHVETIDLTTEGTKQVWTTQGFRG